MRLLDGEWVRVRMRQECDVKSARSQWPVARSTWTSATTTLAHASEAFKGACSLPSALPTQVLVTAPRLKGLAAVCCIFCA